MQSDQKRAFLAVVLSGIVLFVWQYYFAPKPQMADSQSINQMNTNNPNSAQSGSSENQTTLKTNNTELPVNPVRAIKSFTLKKNSLSVDVSSDLKISNFKPVNTSEKLVDLFAENSPLFFHIEVNNKIIDNTLEFFQNNSSSLNFKIPDSDISGEMILDELGRIGFKFAPSNSNINILFNFVTPPKNSTAYNALTFDRSHQHLFISYDAKHHSENLYTHFESEGEMQWLGLDYAHHFFGISFDKGRIPVKISGDGTEQVVARAIFPAQKEIFFNVVFLKKDYDFLKTLGNGLHLTIDFGFFSFVAIPILWLLKFFHNFVSNYGICIILLTLLMRLLTFPLQLTSIKSMKKMQLIQPELNKIREKHKDDPATLQRETMTLFKQSGANPLSGCLPLLLQMPIFFALYTVLFNSVELVGAPLGGWISDLSVKDPFYILPLAMTAAMFMQQKISPTTVTDKTQQKVLMFMPLIFGFFMKDLPSGLSLYMLVSTVFGIIQQVLVFKKIK